MGPVRRVDGDALRLVALIALKISPLQADRQTRPGGLGRAQRKGRSPDVVRPWIRGSRTPRRFRLGPFRMETCGLGSSEGARMAGSNRVASLPRDGDLRRFCLSAPAAACRSTPCRAQDALGRRNCHGSAGHGPMANRSRPQNLGTAEWRSIRFCAAMRKGALGAPYPS